MGKNPTNPTSALSVIIEPSSRMAKPVTITADDVTKYINPLATKAEVFMYLKICESMNLNPFGNGEVYLIKYSSNEKASIVIGYKTHLKRQDATNLVEYWYLETADDLSKCTYVCKRKDWTKEFRWTVYWNELKAPTNPKSPLYGRQRTQLEKTAIARGASLLFPNDVGILPYIPEELPQVAETTSSDMMNGAYAVAVENNDDDQPEDIIDVPFYDSKTSNGTHTEGTPEDIPEPQVTPDENEAPANKDRITCFVLAANLEMNDQMVKEDCCRLFYNIREFGENTTEHITSRKQMTGMQWSAYREILEQRLDIIGTIENLKDNQIDENELADYLCTRFLYPSVSILILEKPNDVLTLLKSAITRNKLDELKNIISSVQKWINLKSIGRESVYELLFNIQQIRTLAEDKATAEKIIATFLEKLELDKDAPRLNNAKVAQFGKWRTTLELACQTHAMAFSTKPIPVPEPEPEAQDDPSDSPEPEGIPKPDPPESIQDEPVAEDDINF